MEIDSNLRLPGYTDTEILMDDVGQSVIDFMSRFKKFRVDEISIDEAEDDICFNAKDCFDQSSTVSLIGLRYTEDENTNEWEKRKLEYSPVSPLPIEFQDLLDGKFENKCSFLLALHPENINNEILSVIGSAHIFVDKKSLKQKLHSALQKWFFNPEAYIKMAENKQDKTERAKIIEPGFIDKLNEMFKYRQVLRDLKQDIEQKDGLSEGYMRHEGKYIVDIMLPYRSSYMHQVFAERTKQLDANFQRVINKARFENYTAAYNALRCKCETEYDFFMNVSLWKDILEQFCDRTHSQYGIVAIIRACMIVVNKEIWKAFLEFRSVTIHKESAKRKNRELQAEAELKKKQLSTREQCIGLIGEEFTKKWEALPSDIKVFLAGASKDESAKKTSSTKNFSVGSFPNTPKKAKILHKASPKTQQSQSESESPAIKPIHKPNKQSNVQRKNYVNPKRTYPNSGQQKQFFRQFGPTNSKNQPLNLEVKLTLILLTLPQ